MAEVKLKAGIVKHLKLLAQAGLIDKTLFSKVKTELPKYKTLFATINFLVEKGVIDENKLVDFYSKRYKLPIVDLKEIEIDEMIGQLIKVPLCRRHVVMPIKIDNIFITVATFFPMNIEAQDDLSSASGRRVKWVLAPRSEILQKIEDYYFSSSNEIQTFAHDLDSADPNTDLSSDILGQDVVVLNNPGAAPVVKLVNLIISDAIAQHASDIHIEPSETHVSVRYRIDGTLKEVATLNKELHNAIVSRIKIMSGLDIAERRIPQDGKARVKRNEHSEITDLRVSTIPTMFGEKVVMRVLDESNIDKKLEDLGHPDYIVKPYSLLLKRPHGVIIVTGPTGSGKSTTLYVSLGMLAGEDVNIVTVEDPIEYHLDGINQVGINARKGMTFAAALRSILRQDPDVIMVGEIRDRETAEIAMEAAQTGHLVLTTLHTNDAASAVTRLLELGVAPYLIQSSLIGVLAQRLVKKLCPACKRKEPVSGEEELILQSSKGLKISESFVPVGCKKCNDIGYKGRIAIGELLVMDDSIREAISQGATDLEIKRRAVNAGMVPMELTAYSLVVKGETSIKEAFRVAGPCNLEDMPPEIINLAGLRDYLDPSLVSTAGMATTPPEQPQQQSAVSAASTQSQDDASLEVDLPQHMIEEPTSQPPMPDASTLQNQIPQAVLPSGAAGPASQPTIIQNSATTTVPSNIQTQGQPNIDDPQWVENFIKSKVLPSNQGVLPQTQRPSLLIIDDDKFVRDTLANALAAEYNIRTAADGVEGLKLINIQAPDVVLLDIVMPRMSGFEVLQMIRMNQYWENVKVIILTAENSREDEILGMHLGADDFIRKPVDLEILKARIKAVLRRR